MYDLEVTKDVDLRPSDDEVQGFTLMALDEVLVELKKGKFKPNCSLGKFGKSTQTVAGNVQGHFSQPRKLSREN